MTAEPWVAQPTARQLFGVATRIPAKWAFALRPSFGYSGASTIFEETASEASCTFSLLSQILRQSFPALVQPFVSCDRLGHFFEIVRKLHGQTRRLLYLCDRYIKNPDPKQQRIRRNRR